MKAIGCVTSLLLITTTSVLAAATPPPAGSYTIVVLPDTQYYCYNASYMQHYTNQVNWIVNNKTAFNIKFVLHEGDIVHHNTATEWVRARNAMAILTNNDIDYAITTGNHDYGPDGNAGLATGRDDTLFNSYFGPGSAYATQVSSLQGTYESGKYENSYHTFSVPGRDWLVLALEFGPRQGVLNWVNNTVMPQYPGHSVILVTHAYLYSEPAGCTGVCSDTLCTGEGVRYGPYAYRPASYAGLVNNGGVTDGNAMWSQIVSPYENFALVCSGHVIDDGAARLASTATYGNVVHQILANYQNGTKYEGSCNYAVEGGQGYLRLVQVQPDGKTVNVQTFSPSCDADPGCDAYRNHADHEFIITLATADCNTNGIPDDQETDTDSDGTIDDCDDCTDTDADAYGDPGFPNNACLEDNCPSIPNADQSDIDSDGIGDICDDDADGDGLLNENDNCMMAANPGQEDSDSDGVGDACDDCPNTLPGLQVDEWGCPPQVPGDMDRDGDVDQEDFGRFQVCLSGSGIPQDSPNCLNARLDGDLDVDTDDFTIFQAHMSGPNNPATP